MSALDGSLGSCLVDRVEFRIEIFRWWWWLVLVLVELPDHQGNARPGAFPSVVLRDQEISLLRKGNQIIFFGSLSFIRLSAQFGLQINGIF